MYFNENRLPSSWAINAFQLLSLLLCCCCSTAGGHWGSGARNNTASSSHNASVGRAWMQRKLCLASVFAEKCFETNPPPRPASSPPAAARLTWNNSGYKLPDEPLRALSLRHQMAFCLLLASVRFDKWFADITRLIRKDRRQWCGTVGRKNV